MGGRIPTAEEARSIYSYVDGLRLREVGKMGARRVPAVNAYVVPFPPSLLQFPFLDIEIGIKD